MFFNYANICVIFTPSHTKMVVNILTANEINYEIKTHVLTFSSTWVSLSIRYRMVHTIKSDRRS